MEALHGMWPEEQVKHLRLEKLIPMFVKEGKKLSYKRLLCLQRKSVSSLLQLPLDSKIAGQFASSKTQSRLKGFYLRYKSLGVRNYVPGFKICQ